MKSTLLAMLNKLPQAIYGIFILYSVSAGAAEVVSKEKVISSKDKLLQSNCELQLDLVRWDSSKVIVSGVAEIKEGSVDAASVRARDDAMANLAMVTGIELSFKSVAVTNKANTNSLGLTDVFVGDDPEEDVRKMFFPAKGIKELAATRVKLADTPDNSFVLLLRSDLQSLHIDNISTNVIDRCGKSFALVSLSVPIRAVENARDAMFERVKRKKALTNPPSKGN